MHQSFHSQSDLTFHCQQTPEHSRHNRSSSRSNRSMQRSNQNIHAGVLTAAETTLNESGSNATAGNFGVNDTVLGQSPRHVAQNGSGVNIRLGLTSKQALERLFHEVNNELQLFSQQNGFNRSFKSFWTSLPYHYHHKLSTLRLHELMLIVLAAVSLLLCYFLEPSLGGTLIIEAVGIITLLFLSSVISWWDLKLQKNDMFTRAQNILDQIQETLLFMQQQSSSASTLPAASSQPLNSLMACQNVWPESLYPSLHAPVSPSVTLQWTHRDQTLVNLPVNLLVRGDVVEVRPGHTVHVKVKQLQMNKSDPMGLLLNPGQTYNPLEGQAEDPCPSARLHSPMDRLACVVQETPFITQLRKCLKSGREKPKSCWENKRFAICVDLIEKKILPVAVLTGLFINGVRYIATASINSVGHQIEMYLLLQVYILIPLVPLLFPVLWLIWTALTTASLFAHCQQQSPVVGKVKQGKWSHFKLAWKHFISIISGMSPSLSRTANLLHGLGSTTIFSVVDKRGVLSWPNPKVERVFFIRPVVQPEETISRSGSISGRHHDQDQVSDDGSVNAVYVPEIMDMSCDQDENFFVHFDDERWQQHLPSLKPLGLNILLNTCNESVEDSYTKFADHLLCVSSLENHSIAVVNRRCACELSEAIGFAKNATESYEVKNYIQSFRESQPFDPSDTFKVRRIKAILRKKTPFPFLCSVVVHDTSTGLQQLFTQGTADMLCDVCPDFWDGRGIHPLSPELRKKIHDFYTRSSLSAYCTAFAYRPVFSDFSKVLDNFYLELPGGKNASAETDNIHSTDYVSDAKGLAKAQSGQIFLGMVVMQYKAMPDVIDLIEDFDSRCIRFVHFSHENELRSRIFAEKLGLETGWNCHVSLFASSAEPQSSEHSSKAASLTTLRSFAQNVIQANEKLKNLQSQTNLNLDTSANVATENNNVSSTMVTGNNISYSNSANVQGANTQEYLSSSHNLSSSHRGCGGAEDSASTSSPLTNQHSELVAANHRLSNMTTAVSTLDRHHPSMMTGAPENASSTIDMRSLPHKQLSRYQTFSNHQDTTIPRYPNHASMEQHNGGLRSHSNQESRMSNIETHYNQSCKSLSKYVEVGVQTPNSGMDDDSSSHKGGFNSKDDSEDVGLDEMFNRLEKLECMKRQSQEEIGLLNGMNSLPSAGGGYNGPSSVWEPKLGAARCNTLSEHDEFVSLPPMSPSSTSPGDTTSSGAISPLQRMTTSPPCHVNAPSVQGSTGGMGHQQPQQHNSNFIPFTCQATMGTNLPHRAQHLKGVCGEPYHSVGDTPSCDLSRDGNSPTDYCYQCSTMNSSNQPNLSRGDRAGIQGGGIESQCSSIESNCINNMCTAATATQQALPHTGYHAAAANHNSMKAVSAVGDFCDCKLSNCSSSANVLADKSAGAGSYFASSQNVHGSSGGPYSSQRNISTQHSGSEVTVVSARGVRSPHMDMSVMQNNTSFNNNALNTSTALRSNSVGRKVAPPPVPMRRFATLSSSGGVDEAIEPEASETLLGGSQQQGHQNYQSQQQHGLQRIKQGLSRTASINSQVTHLPEDAVSRTSETSVGMASVAGSESVMFDDLYDLSNRAKLPRGVENIRPHLEHVDNVPLLVPLFTDCTPEATKEMVVIMQENCEVVCVYGSCLNVTNVDIFLQADVSIGVMPFVPQPCVRHPVNFDTHLPDGRHLTPLGLASTLGALPCSLQVLRNVKLTNVFKSASRLSGNLKTALFFLLSCHLALVCVQILSAICLQPPAFSGSLILWLVGFIFPILSSALLANPTCPNTQQWTTMHKNNPKIHKMEVRDFAACFAMRFLPTCILIPLLELFHLDAMCQLTVEPKECFVPFGNLNSTEPWNGLRGSSSGALVVTQNIITWIFVVCLTLISASFVFPTTYIWKKCPLKNLFWTIISPAIIALQMFYLLSDVKSYSATPYTVWHSSGHGWIIGLIWPLFAVIISECVKTYEIRKAFRQHRRCKLQFGTKLGMNSPF